MRERETGRQTDRVTYNYVERHTNKQTGEGSQIRTYTKSLTEAHRLRSKETQIKHSTVGRVAKGKEDNEAKSS